MSKGWISIHRKIQENPIWTAKPFSKGQAWIDLLILANHEPGKIVIDMEAIPVERGQSARSIKSYALRWGWTESKVRRFLKLLEGERMVNIKATTKTTIVTICNYDSYQNDRRTDDERMTNRRRTDDERMTTNNNENNENNEKKEDGAVAEATLPSAPPVILIPTNIKGEEYPIMQEQRDEYAELYPGVDVDAELRKMRAWSISNPTRRKTSRGMLAFVNSWLNKSQNESTRNSKQPKAKSNGRTYVPDQNEYAAIAAEYGITGADKGADAVSSRPDGEVRGGEREGD